MNRKSSLVFASTKHYSSFSDSDLILKCNALRTVKMRQLITKLPQNKSDFCHWKCWPGSGARLMWVIIGAFLSQLCTIKCKATRFSYNLQDTENHIMLAAFRFTKGSLGG